MKKRVIVYLAGVLLFLAGGCQLNKPGSSSLASVVVDGVSLAQVREATMRVFAEEYYRASDPSARKIVFEREGTLKDRLKYAGYEEALVMQVVVHFEDFGANSTLVRADAYAIRGDFSRSQKLLRIDRRPYQKMLDDVRARIPVAADVQ